MAREDWTRVTRHNRCPICGRDGWCLLARDGTAAICPRTESSRRIGEAGYLHVLEDRTDWRRLPLKRSRTVEATAAPDFTGLAEICQHTAEQWRAIDHLAAELGVTTTALHRLCVGYYLHERATTWPLRSADGRRVVGIVRRYTDGRKRLIKGHKASGLYLPHDLPRDLRGETLLAVEGGSDAAAGLDLGYWTVGRFSCNTAVRSACDLVRSRRPAAVAIAADADGPGRRGADDLASTLVAYTRRLRVVTPPADDLRSWLNAGATSEDLTRLIETTMMRTLKVRANG